MPRSVVSCPKMLVGRQEREEGRGRKLWRPRQKNNKHNYNIPVLSMRWLMHATKTAFSKKIGMVVLKATRLAEAPSKLKQMTRFCEKQRGGE